MATGDGGGENIDGEELSLIDQHRQISKAQQEEELVKVIIPEKPKV